MYEQFLAAVFSESNQHIVSSHIFFIQSINDIKKRHLCMLYNITTILTINPHNYAGKGKKSQTF